MKYLGLKIVGFAVAATVATAIGFALYTSPARPMWPVQSANLNLPTVKQRQDLAQLYDNLAMLQEKALVSTQLPQSAPLFPLRSVEALAEPVKKEHKATAPTKTVRVLPSVNVILRSGFQGTAVIDNRVTQVGESVPGGFVVKAIEAQRVVFVDASKREVVVELPVNRMGSIAAFPSAKEQR